MSAQYVDVTLWQMRIAYLSYLQEEDEGLVSKGIPVVQYNDRGDIFWINGWYWCADPAPAKRRQKGAYERS
jgi:hypothetical protein